MVIGIKWIQAKIQYKPKFHLNKECILNMYSYIRKHIPDINGYNKIVEVIEVPNSNYITLLSTWTTNII